MNTVISILHPLVQDFCHQQYDLYPQTNRVNGSKALNDSCSQRMIQRLTRLEGKFPQKMRVFQGEARFKGWWCWWWSRLGPCLNPQKKQVGFTIFHSAAFLSWTKTSGTKTHIYIYKCIYMPCGSSPIIHHLKNVSFRSRSEDVLPEPPTWTDFQSNKGLFQDYNDSMDLFDSGSR